MNQRHPRSRRLTLEPLEQRALLEAGPFTDLATLGLTGVTESSVAWGDYDNDGKLDFLVSGYIGSGGVYCVAKVYQNAGNGVFQEDTAAGLTGVRDGSAAWGDYDNDGKLDIVLTGWALDAGAFIAKVYHNAGNGVFEENVSAGLTGVRNSSVAWGDYDNDGNLDILLTGQDASYRPIAKVYHNAGNGVFQEDTAAGLTGVFGGSAAWGDYDGDGRLDILLAGYRFVEQGGPVTKVYHNEGGGLFQENTAAGLLDVCWSSVAWGDYDNDGKLDILLAGYWDRGTEWGDAAKVYHNEGGGAFREDAYAGLPGISSGSAAWGDYDNDGSLDILIAGFNGSTGALARIYHNDGNGQFHDISAGLTGLWRSSVAWGDYDNDGRLDILIAGEGGPTYVTKVYHNNAPMQNAVPAAPTGLSANVLSSTSVTVTWMAPADAQTASAGLSYNLRVGTTPGASDIVAPMADAADGLRRLAQRGMIQGTSWTLTSLLASHTYYWSVQAVDTALAGSPFAAEGSFTTNTSSPFVVTNTNDSGPGSLRNAISYANATPGLDTITFNIPGSGVHTIQPLSALPEITDPVIIDGYSQPGAQPNTQAIGDDAVLLIDLDGSRAGSASGLTITADDSSVRGLIINHFAYQGIELRGASHGVIAGNYIGTDAAGAVALGNLGAGIRISDGGHGNLVGSDGNGVADDAERNLISGNGQYAVLIQDAGTDQNVVAGNYIGTAATGLTALGNGYNAVQIAGGAQNNRIGVYGGNANPLAERNVISGNRMTGVVIQGAGTDQNIVAGNFIGLNAIGDAVLRNTYNGIVVYDGAQSNRIGVNGSDANPQTERNVISGNGQSGVVLWGETTRFNVVAGNYVGTDVTGTAALGNGVAGVWVYGASDNRIGTENNGTADAGERNVISGNGVVDPGSPHGVYIYTNATYPTAERNVVAGNYIGTDAAGANALGNVRAGVMIQGHRNADTPRFTRVVGNVISGNATSGDGAGVWMLESSDSTITENLIGTDATGKKAVGNRFCGVRFEDHSSSNLVERNVISGTQGTGLNIRGQGNVAVGNYIGTDVTGMAALPNQQGVRIGRGARDNRVGTDGNGSGDAAERNVISGNTYEGVLILDAGTQQNVVAGNYIGTNKDGSVALGNGTGVTIGSGASLNRIGTSGTSADNAAERNVISGNSSWGVSISGAGTDNNLVAGNYVGTDATGTAALPNSSGVSIGDHARQNHIGTNSDGVGDADEGNLISGNTWDAVGIWGTGADENTVAGNYIGTDWTGEHALGNWNGIVIRFGARANRVGASGHGPADAERNVISGNRCYGIWIAGAGNDENVVAGNYIGVDVTGLTPLGNSSHGVVIAEGAQRNRIGTEGDGRNVISGNLSNGVLITGSGTNSNVVAANYIGTNASGGFPLGNGYLGIEVTSGAQANRIGTDGDGVGDDAERNVISANAFHGIRVSGAGTDGNVVAGNFIGTDSAGKKALGNANCGVLVGWGAKSNRVGTNGDGVHDDAERNLISGNKEAGVVLRGPGTTSNLVAGNYIGTDVDGLAAIPNPLGVGIQQGAQGNTIGTKGTSVNNAGERNVISGNSGKGVFIQDAGSDGNVVAGNYVGTDATGLVAMGNGQEGINIWYGASNRVERNVVADNRWGGVALGDATATFNVVAGNFIGTDKDGSVALGNWGYGVSIANNADNTIGGSTADARNLVSGNRGDGIILQAQTTRNKVMGNYIGTDVTGSKSLANAGSGVVIRGGASNSTIGGSAPGISNVISGNSGKGVFIRDAGSDGNVVAGNYIGTDATGLSALGNAGEGMEIYNNARFNIIGTNGDGQGDEAERNVISGNGMGIGFYGPGTDQNVIAGNYIGVDVTGAVGLGNKGTGVYVGAGVGNRIGTNGDGLADLAEANVISANTGAGVSIANSGTNQTVVAGNRVGTNAAGTAALANTWIGVGIFAGAQHNRIGTNGDGTSDEAERNVISGNGWIGVYLSDPGTNHNVIAGNYIGTNAAGSAALGNADVGVNVTSGAQGNLIGTNGDGVADAAERNVISANGFHGVRLAGAGNIGNNVLAGNYIGTDATGTRSLGNANAGVMVHSDSNRVGTNGDGIADEAERNLISGNGVQGVVLSYSAKSNSVAGNYIGADVSGLRALGNAVGVQFDGSASSNLIGTNGDGIADQAERNVVSGNRSNGVYIAGSGCDGNIVAGNYIGTDATGAVALGNASHGVAIGGGARGNRIGTEGAGRNVISGNGVDGVNIGGAGTSANVVANNYIGTNFDGTAALGNGSSGVALWDASNNVVGGLSPGARNVISANATNGVWLGYAGTTGNFVLGNYIGTDANGTGAIGNRWRGMIIREGASNNTIGGVTEEARNVISGNLQDGVLITGSGTNGNVLTGNYVGTDKDGLGRVANGGSGVVISAGAESNTIGADGDGIADAAEGNLIAFNAGAGAAVTDTGTVNNRIRANSIYSNGGLGIDLGNNGVTANDLGDADAGPNQLQNYPLISAAFTGLTTRVAGSLNSLANTTFTIDFYANTALDPSGYGEGERWLGSTTVNTDASGNADFEVELPAATSVGEIVTATATDPSGNTSEFSAPNHAPIGDSDALTVTEDGQVTITLSATDAETPASGLTFTITSVPAAGALMDDAGNLVEVGDTFVGPPTLTYEPGAAREGEGSDSFSFTVSDPGGLTSDPATVTITIIKAVADGAVTVDAEGIVRIGGTALDDLILITHTDDNQHLKVSLNGTVVSSDIPLASIDEVRSWGRAGNDHIELIDLALMSMLHGGSDNDELIGGAGNDLIFGGAGDDNITGAAGNDMLIGGDGADRIVGSAGHDVLVAGDVACYLTRQALRDIAAAWAAGKSEDSGLVDEVLDEALITGDFDQLTGSSGADWFIVSKDDKVTDFKGLNNKEGDVVTTVV